MLYHLLKTFLEIVEYILHTATLPELQALELSFVLKGTGYQGGNEVSQSLATELESPSMGAQLLGKLYKLSGLESLQNEVEMNTDDWPEYRGSDAEAKISNNWEIGDSKLEHQKTSEKLAVQKVFGTDEMIRGTRSFVESIHFKFKNVQHRQFIKEEEPDRPACTAGTKILIYSNTKKDGSDGTLEYITNVNKTNNNNSNYNKINGLIDINSSLNSVNINNNFSNSNHSASINNMKDEFNCLDLTVTYGPPSQQMRKFLNRYQDHVKSKPQFIETRKSCNIGSNVEIYVKNDSLRYANIISNLFQQSNTNNNITNIVSSINSSNSGNHKTTQLYDILEIRYFYHKGEHIIHLHRWSGELREYNITTARLTSFVENLMNTGAFGTKFALATRCVERSDPAPNVGKLGFVYLVIDGIKVNRDMLTRVVQVPQSSGDLKIVFSQKYIVVGKGRINLMPKIYGSNQMHFESQMYEWNQQQNTCKKQNF